MSGPAGAARSSVAPPAARLVVLGASNVHLGLPAIVRAARELAGGPIDLLAALGHGRSFGRPSSIPGRTLPAILDCRLWDDLAARPPAPTHALITDIGNDLLYGRTPGVTAAWVAECADRLAAAGAAVTLSGLPVDNLPALGAWRYRAFRTFFFPGLRLTLPDLAGLAHELNDRVKELAEARGCHHVALRREWYRFDPIHYRAGARAEAWRTLLGETIAQRDAHSSRESTASATASFRVNPLACAKLYQTAAAERTVLGVRRVCSQPCVVLRDGTRVSLY